MWQTARTKSMEARGYEDALKLIEEKIGLSEDTDEDLRQQKAELEVNLKQTDECRLEGLILQSRCRWYEKGEKNNKYLFKLISRNQSRSCVTN